ncbi:hypothetical protein GQR58_025460 [Nymphon striatum]|nr:hypothetical protein GQR58_025460 [Nymphon striatum]
MIPALLKKCPPNSDLIAIGALVPFLSIHVKELGMTAEETAFIYLISGFVSLFGPLFGGILTEKHGKFRPFIVIFIIFATVAYTGLLFIPGSIRMPVRVPESEFECNGNQLSLLLEKCPNWGRCFATNLNLSTHFEAFTCRYSCQNNDSFFKSADLCFKGQNKVQEMCRAFNASVKDETLKFSATNLFPRANSTKITKLPKQTEMCVYPIANITVSGFTYNDASCSYKKPGCQFVCNMRESVKGKNSIFRKFPPCLEIYGDPFLTFYLYLAVRSVADLCLMTVISLIDSVTVLSISEYKGIYGRSRVWTALGLSIFGPVSGALIDHYSEVENRVNYSPAFIIFDGFMLITAVLTIALPITKDVTATETGGFLPSLLLNELMLSVLEADDIVYLVSVLGRLGPWMNPLILHQGVGTPICISGEASVGFYVMQKDFCVLLTFLPFISLHRDRNNFGRFYIIFVTCNILHSKFHMLLIERKLFTKNSLC